MIVYREQRSTADPVDLLRALGRRMERLPRAPAHDEVVGLLVEVGALEAAVADALAPERDELEPRTMELRAASLASGHAMAASWQGRQDDLARWCVRLGERLRACAALPLPATVELRVPEGFAQYGLYPECYLAAAERVARELRPRRAVCIGFRSIGTTLSAVVAACLEDEGCAVESHTIRPRGHPFDRRPVLGDALRDQLGSRKAALFLLVDEGPGISGSSLAGAAEALAALGIRDDRIVLLPSWDPAPGQLRSESARRRWWRHRRYMVGFEAVWLDSGRMDDLMPRAAITDLSAGRWRDTLLADGAPRPPVQTHHERRKFHAPGVLLRFAGLGDVGHQRLTRARALAEAGFTPHPSRLAHGFLELELVPGTPLRRGEVDAELLDRMAHYLAWLRQRFTLPEDARTDLGVMINYNLEAVGLGAWANDLHDPADGPLIAADGRMLPHEWLRTARGYLKVDALDHHDDHFFPGPVDIAWDLAAAIVEFDMTPDARQVLVERYRRLTGDRTIGERLTYFTVAYVACRIGYASLAADVLRGTPDGGRFRRLLQRYVTRLAHEPPGPVRRRAYA